MSGNMTQGWKIASVVRTLRLLNTADGLLITLVYPMAILGNVVTFNVGDTLAKLFYFVYCTSVCDSGIRSAHVPTSLPLFAAAVSA